MGTSTSRRAVLVGGVALGLSGASNVLRCDTGQVPIADMHSHLFFIGAAKASSRPLGKAMAEGGATLVAWSLVADLPWLGLSARGLQQERTPRPGESVDWFRAELARMKAHAADQGLMFARTPSDIQRALAGERHVVLAVEGTSFLEDDLGQLRFAYDEGVRHVQLVHYSRSTLGDFQTERPTLGGLTEFGGKVVSECNRLGVLVDLAHATSEAVRQAMAISKRPLIWSHGSVTRTERPSWTMPAWQARRLDIETARLIAKSGGVIGLWGLRRDIGGGIDAYADRLLEMADWLGDDHAGFGTDMNAIRNASVSSYADLRRVVETWERRGVDRARVTKLAFGNYARILKQAMEAVGT